MCSLLRPMARCESKSPTATGSSPKWLKRFQARSNRWGCTNRRWRMCSCGKPERHYGSDFSGGGNTVAARVDPILAAEEPRPRRGSLAADFLGSDRFRYRRRRPTVLFPGHGGADGDVLRYLLDDFDH